MRSEYECIEAAKQAEKLAQNIMKNVVENENQRLAIQSIGKKCWRVSIKTDQFSLPDVKSAVWGCIIGTFVFGEIAKPFFKNE